MTRAAIYARYSSDLQSDRSIEDQITLCEAYAAREGVTVTARLFDRARSGGTMHGRDGIEEMMRLAAAGEIDAVVVEALDRLSRDMEDMARIYKRLSFNGVQIKAVFEGTVDKTLVGLKALISDFFRDDLARKIRRGLAGRAADGLVATGLCYGYRAISGEPGKRVIDAAEAAIVRRIYDEFLAGSSPGRIAIGLNADGIRPPGKAASWAVATIKGGGALKRGILRNEMYCGQLVWGTSKKIRNPDTGRQIKRPAAADAIVRRHLPELAIIAPEAWQKAQDELQRRAKAPFSERCDPSYLLSGLIRCGGCGHSMGSCGADVQGYRRIRCHSATDGRHCPSPRTLRLDVVQRAVIDALRRELASPAAIAEFARTYYEERRRLAAAEAGHRADLERRHAIATRERDRLIDCIAKGHGDAAVLGPRSTEAHREAERLAAALATQPAPLKIIALHPAALARYEGLLANLESSLAKAGTAAAKPLRELVESITVYATKWNRTPMQIEIKGRLNALLGPGTFPDGLCVGVNAV